MTTAERRNTEGAVRLTLAPQLGEGLDGAWWPYTASVARELPELIEALHKLLGEVVDISVNWSSLEGVPDLNALTHRGIAVLPGQAVRPQRVMTVTGSKARANLLVIPSRTSRVLAVMVLRQAAGLPILPMHLDTAECKAADEIVCAARAEAAQRAKQAKVSS
jgi:hypothetical protein